MKRTEFITKLRAILLRRRESLRSHVAANLAGELATATGFDFGDAADAALDTEHDLVSSQLAECESTELWQVEDALQRIRDGKYGLCESCGEPLPLARLQALPYATRCVRCQRSEEGHRSKSRLSAVWATIDESEEDADELAFSSLNVG